MALRATSLHPRTRPSFSMSLRTSAHTGVAIRIPAEEPGKSVVLRANSSCFSYLPKVFLFVLWYCKEYGLPRRFAPRNDSGEVSSRPSALQPLTRFCLQHVIANQCLASAHTSFLQHVNASQCAHWRGNPFSPQRSLATWYYFRQIRCFSVFTQSIPFRYVLPQELRIAPSLRSSQ